MYLNLSGSPLEVYGDLPIASKVGNIENNEVYVVSKETSSAYHVYFSKDGKLQSGQIKKELASSAMKDITERPYAREVSKGASYFVYRVRKDANLYDSVIDTIPSGHVSIIKQTIGEDGNKNLVHFCKDNTRYLGYVTNITSDQKTSILDRAFRKESINGTQHYIFQLKKQRRVYDSSGGSWGRVGTYMLVACTDAKFGNSNSYYKKINFFQKNFNLS